jgi:hypothetical protein
MEANISGVIIYDVDISLSPPRVVPLENATYAGGI